MCTNGIMYEYESEMFLSIDDALRGWGFDMKRLDETERGRGGVSLSPPKVPRADFTNVHPTDKDMPGFEGTTQQLNDLSIYKPMGKTCEYSGLLSTEDYMER